MRWPTPSGAIARVPHGIANGILLPHVMAFNLDDAAEGYAMVAEALGVREKGMDEREAAEAAVAEMRLIPPADRPSRSGCRKRASKEEDLVKAAALSLSDGAIVNNPRMVLDEEEVLAVYRAAF